MVRTCLLVALLLMPTPAAAQEEESARLRLLHFGDLDGRFATLGCTAEERGRVDFSNFLATLERESADRTTLVLSPGNLLGQSPFFEFMLRQGETGILTVARLLAACGAVAVVPGLTEFRSPFRIFLESLRDLQAGGVPYRADNARPAAAAEASPDLGKGPLVVTAGAIRVAIISLVGPEAAAQAPPGNLDGLAFLDPAATATELAGAARASDGADLVIALVNLEANRGRTEQTLGFAAQVKGIDLIVAGGLPDPDGEGPPVVADARLGWRGPHLVGSPAAPGFLGLVDLTLVRRHGRWSLATVTPTVMRVDSFSRQPAAAAVLAQAVAEFCSLGERMLGRSVIKPEMNRDEFFALVMEVVRRQLEADLAVLSADTISLPAEAAVGGPVRTGFLARTVAPHEMVLLSVVGSDLATFLNGNQQALPPSGHKGLRILGARRLEDGSLEINGRPLNPNRRYQIATSDFLAGGGRGLLTGLTGNGRTRRHHSGYFAQELLHRFFERSRTPSETEPGVISLSGSFPDLWDRPLWEFLVGLNGSLTNVAIDNGGDYAETQLKSRSPHTGFQGELRGQAILSTRDHRMAQFARVQFGMMQVGEGEFDEMQDLVTEELSYSWTRWRNRLAAGRLWAPAPLARLKLETEFTPAPTTWMKGSDGQPVVDALGNPLPAFAPYHHLEATGLLGAEWFFGPRATAGLGYGLRSELLASPGSGREGVHAGAQLHYQIDRLPLFSWGAGSSIMLDSRFELFFSDWADQQALKGSGSTRLVASVFGPLAITLGLDFFLFKSGDSPLAHSVDTLLGLAFSYEAASQHF